MSILTCFQGLQIKGYDFKVSVNVYPGGPGTNKEIEQMICSLREMSAENLPVLNVVEGQVIQTSLNTLKALYSDRNALAKYNLISASYS